MGFAMPDFKTCAATVLRYDRATVKAGSYFIMAKNHLAVLNIRAVKSTMVSA